MEEKDPYYPEAQNTLRSYDQKLWQIPSLFFISIGFIFQNLKLDEFTEENIWILVFGILFLLILILLYNKAHIFHVIIQKKINEIEKSQKELGYKKVSLTSMTNHQLKVVLNGLEKEELSDPKSNLGARFNCLKKALANFRVSSWILNIMLFSLFIMIILLSKQVFNIF